MNRLTPRQRRAVEALLVASTLEAAAERAGVHRNTLRAWMADALFCTELHKATTATLDATVRRLTALSAQACDVLADMMSGKTVVDTTKLRAADIVLARLLAMRELHDLERRIAALEQAQHGKP